MTHPRGDLDAISEAVQWLSNGIGTTRKGSTSGRYIPSAPSNEQAFSDALVALKLFEHDVRRKYHSLDTEEANAAPLSDDDEASATSVLSEDGCSGASLIP